MLKRLQTAVWVAAFACIAFGFGYGFEVWRASQQTPEANQKPAATSQEQPKTQDSKTYLRQTGTAPTQTVGEKGNGTVGEKDDGIHQGLYWIGSRLVAIIEFVDGHEGFFVTLFTAALAVFTWLLAKRTRDLWEAGEKQIAIAKQSADAAKEVADTARAEFAATHRPKIKIHVAEFKHTPTEVGEQERAGASVLCFNVGESTAKDVEVRGEIFKGDAFAVDVQRPLIKKVAQLVSGEKLRFEVMSGWLASEVAAGPRQGQNFYLVGWIAYLDGNGLRRETAYCFRAHFGSAGGPADRWVSARKPEYEYDY